MKRLSRRQVLMLLAGASSGCALASCGTIGAGLWLMSQEDQVRTPQIQVFTNEPPTPVHPRPPVISRADWGAREPDHNATNEYGFYSEDNPEGWRIYDGELADVYQTVVIHHSAFYEGTDLSTLREVQRLHRDDRQWADIAYHFLVGQSGIIYEGRDWSVRGTHVAGYNTGSIGICLLGNFMETRPTDQQLRNTQLLVNWLGERLKLTHLATHRNFNTLTECPGDNLYAYAGQFAAVAGLAFGIDGYIPPTSTPVACACCQPIDTI